MNSSDYRKEGREKLSGKWVIVIGITLLFSLISLLINYLSENVNGLFALLSICIVPIGYGMTYTFVNMYNGETSNFFDFIIIGLQKFGRSWLIALHTLKKLLAPCLLLVASIIIIMVSSVNAFLQFANDPEAIFSSPAILISTIVFFASLIWLFVASYYYSMSTYIAVEDESISPRDAVEKSKELMTGNRGKLFCLQLSFFGWLIVAGIITSVLQSFLKQDLASVIGCCWLTAYLQFATISFYNNLKK